MCRGRIVSTFIYSFEVAVLDFEVILEVEIKIQGLIDELIKQNNNKGGI